MTWIDIIDMTYNDIIDNIIINGKNQNETLELTWKKKLTQIQIEKNVTLHALILCLSKKKKTKIFGIKLFVILFI